MKRSEAYKQYKSYSANPESTVQNPDRDKSSIKFNEIKNIYFPI